MAKEPREFEISKLLQITRTDKYATAVAAFEVIDQAERLDLPRKWKNRKPAVQAMMALSDEMVRFGFIADEERQKLREELQEEDNEVMDVLTSAAPVTDESEEDLDEIGETEPVDVLGADSEDSDESDEDEDEDEDEDLDDGDADGEDEDD